MIWVFEQVVVAESCSIQYTGRANTHPLHIPRIPYIPSKCRDTETGLSVAGWASQVAKIIFFKFYIAIYNLLNIDGVISKA